jgi:two-component system cell cycle response regulator DivK
MSVLLTSRGKARYTGFRGSKALLVLIVDDNADCRHMYRTFLRHVGIDSDCATTGHEAVELAPLIRPDVIVMDLVMPGLDGWRAIRRLKADQRTRDIPVIALTGQHLTAADERHAAGAGFAAYCRKPCLPADLVKVVQKAAAADSPPVLSREL